MSAYFLFQIGVSLEIGALAVFFAASLNAIRRTRS